MEISFQRIFKIILVSGFLVLASLSSWAGEKIEYTTKNSKMEGYLALPKNLKAKNPAVLIVHDWMGLTEDIQKKADELALMGYIAFAADIYGKDFRPKNAKEAAAFSSKYKNDLPALRERVSAALKTLVSQKSVDVDKIVAFGYCFGGTTVLELGRAGASVAGIVSFHGGLATTNLEDAKRIQSKVLVLHGAIDPLVPEKEVLAFQDSMNKAGVDYQFVSYSGAVHSFTNKKAGSDISKGAAYNEAADRRSWQAFRNFIAEVAPL